MKTAEDCLDTHGVRIFGAQQKRILEAMEEYASQFKAGEPIKSWLKKCSEAGPDCGCSDICRMYKQE